MKIFILITVLLLCKNTTNTQLNPVDINELLKSHQWMNEAADPCEDFFNFTCGGYIRDNKIPEGKAEISTFANPYEDFKKRIKLMLEEPIEEGDFKPLNKVKMFYKACTNTERKEKSGLSDMKQLVEKLGGWPVADPNWNEENYDWAKLNYKMADIGIEVDNLIDISISVDYEDKTAHRIKVQKMTFAISNYYLRKGKESTEVQNYLQYMTEMAALFGAGDNARNDMEQALDIEIKLAEASLKMDDQFGDKFINNKFIISELQSEFPNIPWLEYLTKILVGTATLDDNEPIIVPEIKYTKMLNTILAETPKRTLANFQIWHMVHQLGFTLSEDIVNRKNALLDPDDHIKYDFPAECLFDAREYFPELLGSMYIRKYADSKSKEIADEMADLLIAEFRKSLNETTWMNEAFKTPALEKAKTMIKLISYTEDLLDDKKITAHSKELHLDEDNYLYIRINLTRYLNFMEYSYLRKPVDQEDTFFEFKRTAEVVGTYDPQTNSLMCAAGLLHHENNIFNKHQPMYMNFGRLGTQLSKEFISNFYNIGRYYLMWGSNETKALLQAKTKCFKDQFAEYAKANNFEEHADKFQTESYVSAAVAGQRQAYHAYKKWRSQHGAEEYRPNLAYTQEQFFWINSGQIFCYKSSIPEWNSMYHFQMHTIFGNVKDFAKDWSCPSGSNMNPSIKCNIW